MRSTKPQITDEPIIAPLFYILAATSFLCVLLISLRETQVLSTNFKFLIWNLFLAWLPLVVSMAALLWARWTKGSLRGVGLLISGVAWILLFPNAPYLTTDLIHLILIHGYRGFDPEGLLLWYDLVLFFLFMWCGLLLGYLSMHHYHKLVIQHFSVPTGWLFVFISSYLSGFGVYLGRVVRLNSWDILSPLLLLEEVVEAIHKPAVIFSILFGTLIVIVYVSLYVISGGFRTKRVTRPIASELTNL
ncbi:MAG: DUF1361 domain-containing protein [Candidatus Cohnella colombiensis]|uniref:DUF1361 domain-containing protein n=1 Tax=Candidatus Cohnella colombiensis TaxID=3121368 RepID=A0AA95EZA7_9BACL|nr:MAG: DUF1361 domain-containing protein [Cohnella sp.]